MCYADKEDCKKFNGFVGSYVVYGKGKDGKYGYYDHDGKYIGSFANYNAGKGIGYYGGKGADYYGGYDGKGAGYYGGHDGKDGYRGDYYGKDGK